MNFGEMRERTRLQLGNLPDAHPILGNLDDWLNDAIRDFPQRDLPGTFDRRTLFPELTRKTLVQPQALQGWVLTPSTFLAPLEVVCYRNEVQPNPNTVHKGHPMVRMEAEEYDLLDKEPTGWATIWSWFDDRIYLWPVPSEGYLGWLYLYYLFEQPELTEDEHVPLINKRWHRAIVNLATSYGESAQGHKERAAFFEAECDKQVMKTLDWIGRSEARQPTKVSIAGDVCASEVYD